LIVAAGIFRRKDIRLVLGTSILVLLGHFHTRSHPPIKKNSERMKSLIAITLALILPLGVSSKTNAAEASEKTIALAGTTWSGKDSDGDSYVYTFEPDGTLAYQSPSGSFRNGTWNQFGRAVYLEINGHISERLGEITDNTIEGKAWNNKGRSWTWTASRRQ
jgi:hypothetical protein